MVQNRWRAVNRLGFRSHCGVCLLSRNSRSVCRGRKAAKADLPELASVRPCHLTKRFPRQAVHQVEQRRQELPEGFGRGVFDRQAMLAANRTQMSE